MTKSIQPPINQLEGALQQRPFLGSIEVREDMNEMEDYISLPVAHQRAVDVEYVEQDGAKFFVVSHRAWDQTGGLSLDDEVFTVNADQVDMAALLIEFFVKHLVAEEDRLNAQWMETP